MGTSTGSRSFKLLKLAAKVGTSEVARSINETIKSRLGNGEAKAAAQHASLDARVDQAKYIAENLAQLKGAAMKVGQMLSIDSADYFPPEAMAILSKLQASAEPVSFEVIRQVLEEDLNAKALGELDELQEDADAAASIGQVHRAKLQGRDVAVKVQYPGVAESIDSDLKILRGLASTIAGATGRNVDLSQLFQELSRVLKQEADYTTELTLMQEYRKRIESLPDAELYRVPEPIPSHSGRRVLTMTWETGATLDTWLKSRPSPERRERLGHAILQLFCREFFEWGLVQTDPNFANFLIGRDNATGKDTLVLLDFGATIRYEDEFRLRYKSFLSAMGTLDAHTIVSEGIAFGLISEKESEEAKQLFSELMKLSIEPFFAELQPFRFEDADYARRTRDAGMNFAKALKHSPPPERILFLQRKLGGLFNFVRKLDVELDLSPYWRQMVDTLPPAAKRV
jgi:aarF domain-containing kinase